MRGAPAPAGSDGGSLPLGSARPTGLEAWQNWAALRLQRDYLAVPDEVRYGPLGDRLKSAQTKRCGEAAIDAAVIAVLDGAPEYSQCLGQACHYNGHAGAVSAIQAKDACFHRLCADALKLYGGVVLDEPAGRTYQDGCAAVFPGKDGQGVVSAIAAACHLHALLVDYNEHRNPPWTERWHARVAVGGGFADVLPILPHARRGQTMIAWSVWNALDVALRMVLFASGAMARRG